MGDHFLLVHHLLKHCALLLIWEAVQQPTTNQIIYCIKNYQKMITASLNIHTYQTLEKITSTSQKKQLTFGDANTGFPVKWHLRIPYWRCLTTPILGTSDTSSVWNFNISQMSFYRETSDGNAKCLLFSQAQNSLTQNNLFLKVTTPLHYTSYTPSSFPLDQICSSKFWAWPCIVSNF